MKEIQVLMSTYNGEKYLREQLNSIIEQVGVKVSILVRDDGSNDGTIEILEEYSNKGLLQYYNGKNIGYGKSFLDLIRNTEDFEYYAFADQDDVWDKNKLYKAIQSLEIYPENYNLLYASGLTYVDSEMNFIKDKKFDDIKLTLGSALVRQRLAGCTMVFNNRLRKICTKCYDISDKQFGHDGWVYLLCLATGGKVVYDDNSYIKFRRHGCNKTVSGNGLINRLKREFSKFSKLKDTQYNVAVKILDHFYDDITDSSKETLEKIYHYKDNVIRTICLMLNKEINCGIKSVDLFTKIIILMRCF